MSESFPLANYGLPAPNSWQVARITNDLEPKDLIRTQRDVTGLILAAIQEEPEGKAAGTNSLANLRHYDGLRSKYNLWDKAVQRNLATVGLLKLDKLYKNNSLDSQYSYPYVSDEAHSHEASFHPRTLPGQDV
ncbi:hypothetical protein RI054_31g124830 [Pseudoscourfieldia marina]